MTMTITNTYSRTTRNNVFKHYYIDMQDGITAYSVHMRNGKYSMILERIYNKDIDDIKDRRLNELPATVKAEFEKDSI